MSHYSYEINSGISSNKKINLNNSSDFNLNDNFHKNYQNSYDLLRSKYNFNSSNDSLKSSRIFAGSNNSLYSVDYLDDAQGELKEKPIQTKRYKLERKDKSSGITNYLMKLNGKYEKILGKLLGFYCIEINKFTDIRDGIIILGSIAFFSISIFYFIFKLFKIMNKDIKNVSNSLIEVLMSNSYNKSKQNALISLI
ncbi:hypothetical protein MKS88_002178 [Plasmodium brasilianum]|uniref:Uncharacterized protein n=1 Tax=Plasmodium brasilianum TaxID=5824 RepID=A0ACB9YBU1_PLABR|nr:hypothetical protein MKS88_002178 [Plasmodium brasilianum]